MRIPKTLLLFFLLAVSSVHAQVTTKGSSQVFVGYTYPSLVGDLVQSYFGGDYYGPLSATYQYCFSNKLAVGVQAGISSGKTSSVNIVDTNGILQSYQAEYILLSIAVKADYHYLKSTKYDLYSGISIGYVSGSPKITGSTPVTIPSSVSDIVVAINALGFRYMFSPHIGVFAEVGYGTLGIATAGLSASLGNSPKKGKR